MDAVIHRYQALDKRGMLALGSWAAGNIAVNGGLLLAGPRDDRLKHFYQMNLAWNVVNGALAGYGLIRMHNSENSVHTLADMVKRQARTETLFLVNSALDVAYIVGGVYLQERGKHQTDNGALLSGFGNAVILQGGFLLVFDMTMYLLHRRNGKNVYGILDNFTLSSGGIGYRLQF